MASPTLPHARWGAALCCHASIAATRQCSSALRSPPPSVSSMPIATRPAAVIRSASGCSSLVRQTDAFRGAVISSKGSARSSLVAAALVAGGSGSGRARRRSRRWAARASSVSWVSVSLAIGNPRWDGDGSARHQREPRTGPNRRGGGSAAAVSPRCHVHQCSVQRRMPVLSRGSATWPGLVS